MTLCLQTVVITKQRLARLISVGNTKCRKCGKEMIIDEEMIKKTRKKNGMGGNHNYYHKECYERIYIE
jgi:hypothetical protein